jgi:transposase
MDAQPCFIGIDVSKATLDLHARPSGEVLRAGNDADGIAALVARVVELAPTLVVMEATGGLEHPLAAALATAGVSAAVVNPRQARDFAKATGTLAKTDAIGAAVLAHFAEAIRPQARPLPDARTRELAESLGRRRQLLGMRTAEANRLGTVTAARAGTSRRIWRGWRSSWGGWTGTWVRRSAPARCGGSTTTCCNRSRAWTAR